MLTDTSAVVLRSVPFSETSLIVTMLTEKHGKAALMARGARRNKSKFTGLMEPGSCVDVSYYYKPSREVQNIKEAAQIMPTWNIYQDIKKMAVSMATLELSSQLCHSYEPMPEVFQFLKSVLGWLHSTTADSSNILPYIQFRLAQMNGFAISADESLLQDLAEEPRDGKPCYLNIEIGLISNKPENGLHIRLTDIQAKYFRYILKNKKQALLKASFPPTEIKELIRHMDTYFQFHVEDMKPRKSDAIFDQIFMNTP
ncbi:DNA repair protein RecO [Balneolaceae bacterium ANBcel3]|nr:DNA repair protein RecO [Balneolaceae bacterium ANBcel3]